jgi:hypothetical protein
MGCQSQPTPGLVNVSRNEAAEMSMGAENQDPQPAARPKTFQGDLSNLPAALTPLRALPNWCVWKWELRNGRWQKPPHQAHHPERYADTSKPRTWTIYESALATYEKGHGEGITFILTEDCGLAAIDLDECRDPLTTALASWVQPWIGRARKAKLYIEVTPSGTGLRFWGTASGDKLHSKVRLKFGPDAAFEPFRATHKALTITGLELGNCPAFGSIDQLMDQMAAWAELNKAEPKATANGESQVGQNDYTGDDYERFVREGAPEGANPSDTFHACVWHFAALGLSQKEILDKFLPHPNGVGSRYWAEDRLGKEVKRSFKKWKEAHPETELDLFSGANWKPPEDPKSQEGDASAEPPASQEPPELATSDEEEIPIAPEPEPKPLPGPKPFVPDPNLPPLFFYGDEDPLSSRDETVKGLLPKVCKGLISGQWGTYKTFLALELGACIMLPIIKPDEEARFARFRVKRPGGVLFIAAEGAFDIPIRIKAVMEHKYGVTEQAPFVYYKWAPPLLHKKGPDFLLRMVKQAADGLTAKFGVDLVLIVIDTMIACAGYDKAGDEQDSVIGAHLLGVLERIAKETTTCVLGVDHFGKAAETGTRGSSVKETNADVVIALLGNRDISGRVTNPTMATRKVRSGRSGEEFPFTIKTIEFGLDEDGDPIDTLVIDWNPTTDPTAAAAWPKSLRIFHRILIATLVSHGAPFEPQPGEIVQAVAQELVREAYYREYPADGDTEKKRADAKKKAFGRAVKEAQAADLIGISNLGGTTRVWIKGASPPSNVLDFNSAPRSK